MKRMGLTVFCVLLVCALAPVPAWMQQKPLTKEQVLNLVRNQLGDETGAKAVEQRGIDFEPTDDFLNSLRAAGGNEAFLQAVRGAKRDKAPEPTPKKPLNQVQIVALLAGDVPSRRVATLVQERGLDFEPTDEYIKSLSGVGAEDVLLKALRSTKVVKPARVDPAVQVRQAQVQQHLARGVELSRAGKSAEAEQEYRAALQLDPNNSDLHAGLAFVLAVQDKLDDALMHGREAVRLDQSSDNAHNRLGVALSAKGDLDGAIAEYREALQLNPNNDSAHNSLANALAKKHDGDGAIAEFREALRLNPNNDIGHTNLGITLYLKGDTDGAIAEYREALRLNPNNGRAHYVLGYALEMRGEQQSALDEYRTAYTLNPKAPDIKKAYEDLLQKMNK